MSARVGLMVNGMIYEGWKEVSVSRSLGEAASTFSLTLTERAAASSGFMSWRIQPGDACQVLYGGVTVLTGHVDCWNPAYDAASHGVQCSGRSKTADLVDSSAVVPGGEMRGYGLDAIARRLGEPHGLTVKTEGDIARPFDVVRIQQGETGFEVIERLARLRGCLCHDDAEGNLLVDQVPVEPPVTAVLVEGGNILSASATFRADQRHSEYIVKGQRPGTDQAFGEDAASLVAVGRDENVKRHRPLILLAEGASDGETLARRADWEAAARAGESVEASITVQGWTHAGGLWTPGHGVHVHSPMLNLDRVLALRSVTFTQGADGTKAALQLVPPEALTPEPAKQQGGGPSSGGAAARGSSGSGGGASSGGQGATDIWNQSRGTEKARPQ